MPDANVTPDSNVPAITRIFITPAPGLRVAKPSGGYLAAEGEEVNSESYWLRRIADGDVTEGPAPAAQSDPAMTDAPAATGRAARARS